MNNLLSYCGLVDVRINASDKDLPVIAPAYVVSCPTRTKNLEWYLICMHFATGPKEKYYVYEIQFVYSIYCRILIHSHMHKEFNI